MNKFSCVLMNPPYSKCKTFFAKVLNLSIKTITIQPVNWLLGKTKTKNICNQIKDCYVNIELLSSYEGFDAAFWSRLSINFIDMSKEKEIILFDQKTKQRFNFNSIYDISEISLDEDLKKFYDIVKPLFSNDNFNKHKKLNYSYSDSNSDNDRLIKLEKPIIKSSMIRGHVDQKTGQKCDDFYTLISNNEKEIRENVLENTRNLNVKTKSGKNKIVLYFLCEDEYEQRNLLNYMMTDFCRACLLLIKTNSSLNNGELKYIPWFDFSDEHFSQTPREIDDWLFEKYNISDEIRQHIEEILPDYYGIRN